jgi:hypothetical protein
MLGRSFFQRPVLRFGRGALISLFILFSAAHASASSGPVASPEHSARIFTSAKEIAGGGGRAAPPVENLTIELALGIGWALCPDAAQMPSLESATNCEGEVPELQNVVLTLTPQAAAKPEWHLWSGKVLLKTKFQGIEGTAEYLLSFAKTDGTNYAFVEGRVFTSVSGKNATYFSGVAPSFEQLQATTAYGPAAIVHIGKEKDQWLPYTQFARKGYP